MAKPIVFLSHCSRDSKSLKLLKEALDKKTHGTIDFFLSSDGESIPFGKNWVASIETALNEAKICFVFVSANSVTNGWVHFESGFTYGKGVHVIPVAMPGIDLGKIPPPLSLLQGFNVHSHESLNNIFAVLNRTFDAKHSDSFSKEEYEQIFSSSDDCNDYFKIGSSLISTLSLTISDNADPISKVKAYLEQQKMEFVLNKDVVISYGFEMQPKPNNAGAAENKVAISIAPGSLRFAFETLDKALATDQTPCSIKVLLWFPPSVAMISERYYLTGKLHGSEIKLTSNGLSFKDLIFNVQEYRFSKRRQPYLTSEYAGRFADDRLQAVIPKLFELGILYEQEPDLLAELRGL